MNISFQWLFFVLGICFFCTSAKNVSAQGTPAFVGFSGQSCQDIQLRAERMDCTPEGCLLTEQVSLTCPDMRLWSDKLFVELDEKGMFRGAHASGDVTLVEGKNVLRCSKIDLGPDRIKGSIYDADIRVENKPVSLLKRPTTKGRVEAFVSGQIERDDEKHLTLRDGTFTLCDCADGEPSWTVHAPRIDVTLNERATVYWPSMWIHALGLFQMPLTPPLAPISVPLKKRAAGFLTPEISFLRMPSPMVDLPFFVPLGDAYDLTLKPGMRFDWGAHQKDDFLSWGAPRFGTRLRYRPSSFVQGEFNVHWTYDPYHWGAKWLETDAYERAVDKDAAQDLIAPPPWKKTSPQWDLTHRVLVDLEQKVDFSPDLDWSTAIHWMSDDRILSDFALTMEEQSTLFMPSRSQVHWRPPATSLRLAADYFLLLNNSPEDYSNVWGAETKTQHIGPLVELKLLPREIWNRIFWDAQMGLTRYGTWLADKKAMLHPLRYGPWYPDENAALYVSYGRAGLSMHRRLGFFNVSLAGHTDTLVSQAGFEPHVSTFSQLDASIETTFYRAYSQMVHTIRPLFEYRWLPTLKGDVLELDGLDEHLDRAQIHQAVLGVEQELWSKDLSGIKKRKLVLNIRQPYSLREKRILQTDVRLGFDAFGILRLNAFGSLDLQDEVEPWRERSVGGRLSLGPFTVSGLYSHWHPQAERFERSLYELAAVTANKENTGDSDNEWVHSLRAGARLSLFSRLSLSYGTTYLLPLNDDEVLEEEDDGRGFLVHNASIAYRSACRCWGLSVNATLPAETMFDGMRLTFLFSIGDYTVGGRQ